MKIVIPVAGAGAKLRPHTYTQPKPLIPLAGKTILSFIMDQFIEAGMIDFVFVIGYLGEKIKHFVAEKYPGINASFVIQDQHSGTGHAVLLTQHLLAPGEEMLVVYGDTICEFDLNAVLACSNSTVGIKKVDDPRDFGVAELNAQGQILHAIEKPKIPKSNMALVGIYKIKETEQLFRIINEAIQQNAPQEEYTLTQAIDTLAKSGVSIDTFSVNNWFDCGKKESLLATNAILLAEAEYASEEIPFFDNTIILHPVSIAKGCLIENSIIGPNVSIGEHAIIRGSMIRDSIIGSYSEIKQIALHSSLIGSDASISGASQRLNIGDNTEIDFSK